MIKKLLLIWCLLPLILHAADSAESDPGVWKGVGEFGYTSTSGNSDSENLNASLGVSREIEKWKHSASLRAIQAESEGETSADSLVFKGRSEYGFGEKSYAFGKLRYEDDEFSGYDYQTSVSFGVGSRFIDNDKHLLDASAGLGYRTIKNSATKDTEDEAIVTTDLIYEYRISETATFRETILIESGDKNTYSESDTSLTARIAGNLAAKISYLVKRNSEVPPDTDKTDEITTISLVYNF